MKDRKCAAGMENTPPDSKRALFFRKVRTTCTEYAGLSRSWKYFKFGSIPSSAKNRLISEERYLMAKFIYSYNFVMTIL